MKIDPKNITLIHSIAAKCMTDISTRTLYKGGEAQTYAFTCAVIMFLNGQGLLKEEVQIDENIDPKYIKD